MSENNCRLCENNDFFFWTIRVGLKYDESDIYGETNACSLDATKRTCTTIDVNLLLKL